MKWMKTAIVVAVAAGMAVATLYLYHKEKQRDAVDLHKGRVFAFDIDRVEQIEIRNARTHVRCRRQLRDGSRSWRLAAPVDDIAERGTIDVVLAAVAGLTKKATPGAGQGSQAVLGTYGLDKPEAEAAFLVDGERHSLKLGALSVDGAYRYALATGSDGVILVEKAIFDTVNKPLSAFRGKDIIDVKRHTARKLALVGRDGARLELVQSADGWQLTEPMSDCADTFAVGRLIDKLDRLRVAAFVDDSPEEPVAYGLSAPVLEIAVVTSDAPDPITARFGKEFGPENDLLYYTSVSGRDGVFGVKVDAVHDLAGNELNDFRSRDIAQVTPTQVTRIEVTGGQGGVQLARADDGKWYFSPDMSAPADGEAVRKFLVQLNNIEVASFVDDNPTSLAPYGLAVATEIRLGTESGELRKILLTGASGEEGLYARRPGFPSVFTVRSDFAYWTETEFAFLPGKVLRLPKAHVTQVRFESPRRSGTIEKTPEGKWRMTEPIEAACDEVSVDAALSAMCILDAERFIARVAGSDAAELGFAPPSFKLRVTTCTRDVEKETTILLGKRTTEGFVYARVSDHDLVFVLTAWQADELMREPLPRNVGDALASEPVRLAITRGGETTILAATPDGRWAVEGLAAGETDSQKAKLTARTFDYLRALRYAGYAPSDLSAYGLDKPQAVLVGTFADGEVTVRIGGTDSEGQYFALVEGQPSVLVLSAFDVQKFLVTPSDFRR